MDLKKIFSFANGMATRLELPGIRLWNVNSWNEHTLWEDTDFSPSTTGQAPLFSHQDPGHMQKPACRAPCAHVTVLLWGRVIATLYLQASWDESFRSRILITHLFEAITLAFLMKRNGIVMDHLYNNRLRCLADKWAQLSDGLSRGHSCAQWTHQASLSVTCSEVVVFKVLKV